MWNKMEKSIKMRELDTDTRQQFSILLHCGLRTLKIGILLCNSLSYLSVMFRWITHIVVGFNIKNKSPRAPNSERITKHFINAP